MLSRFFDMYIFHPVCFITDQVQNYSIVYSKYQLYSCTKLQRLEGKLKEQLSIPGKHLENQCVIHGCQYNTHNLYFDKMSLVYLQDSLFTSDICMFHQHFSPDKSHYKPLSIN